MSTADLSQQREKVLDLHDRGEFSVREMAAVFRAFARIPPDAVLLSRAQRDALRAEIGEHSQANTIWGVEMRVVPESRVHDGPCDRLLAERDRFRKALEQIADAAAVWPHSFPFIATNDIARTAREALHNDA